MAIVIVSASHSSLLVSNSLCAILAVLLLLLLLLTVAAVPSAVSCSSRTPRPVREP
jgi:hypothetical protein